MEETVDILKWVIGMLVSAIGGLIAAIIYLWKSYLKKVERAEECKERIYKDWQGSLERKNKEMKSLSDGYLKEYKSLLSETMALLSETDSHQMEDYEE